MRILFLHQYYNPEGGIGNDRTRYFAEYFAQQGHEVVVLTSTAKFSESLQQSMKMEFTQNQVRVIAFPLENTHYLNYWKRLKIFWKFYREIIQEAKQLKSFDIVYACSTPLSVAEAGRVIARKINARFVFEIQDVWPDAVYGLGIIKNPVLKFILDYFTQRIYKQADLLVALSKGMIQQINRLGDFSSKIIVSPNGTDTVLFHPDLNKKGEIIEFIYTGAIGLANGLDQLIGAIHLLKNKEIKGIHFTIVGNGNRYLEIREMSIGLDDWIDWIDEMPKSQIPALLNQASVGIVCFAPVKELESNSANKFFDYLASGLPVLLNYGGWQAEILRRHRCGISAKPGDVHDFAEKIIEMASNPEGLKIMGQNSRRLAVEEFDRERLAREALLSVMSYAGTRYNQFG